MKKIAIYFLLPLIIFAVVGYGLFRISKSRTFQFFGTLVDRVETNQKVVALTFDDAPTSYTDEVLEILQQKQVRATFYAIGQQIEKYPNEASRILAAGHELGNHSYSHQRILLKSQSFIADEIEKTNQLIREAGYEGAITFRPPYGKKLFGLPWYLSKQNIPSIMADVEPDTYGTTTEFLVAYTIEHTKPGSIILLHPLCETCGEQRKAIPLIIDALQHEGYTFITVSELLASQK